MSHRLWSAGAPSHVIALSADFPNVSASQSASSAADFATETAASASQEDPKSFLSPAPSDFLLRLVVATLLCAAASPSPIGLPFALVCAFQPAFVQQWWSAALDTFSVDVLLIAGLPLLGSITYFTHGFICLAFDSYWRPAMLEEYKIQPGKNFDTARVGLVTPRTAGSHSAVSVVVAGVPQPPLQPGPYDHGLRRRLRMVLQKR